MALFKLNGMTHFVDVNSISIKKVSNGRFAVTYDRVVADDGEVICEGRTFTVVGGRASGGAAHEWFCHHPEMFGDTWLPTKSMAAAIKLGACY